MTARLFPVVVLVVAVAVMLGGCASARTAKPPPRHDLHLQMGPGPQATTVISVGVGGVMIPLGTVGVPNQTTGVDASSITVTFYPDDEQLCLLEWRDLFAEASHANSHQFFRVVRLDQATKTLLAGDWLLAASGEAAGVRTITRPDGAQVPLVLSISGSCQVLHKSGWIGLVRGQEVRALRPDEKEAAPVLIDAFRLITWYRIDGGACHHDSSSFVALMPAPSVEQVIAGHPWLKFGGQVAHDPAWYQVTAEPALSGDHPCVDLAP